jgi:hypothetical protein
MPTPTHIRAYATPAQLAIAEQEGAALPSEIVYFPAGASQIHASSDREGGYHGEVIVSEATASRFQQELLKLRAAGGRAWIDADHTNGAAMGDVREFSWAPSRGVIARVDWTPAGERALRERAYCAFSPAFLLDRQTSQPIGLSTAEAVGALVNAPAFGARLQLIAAAASPEPKPKHPAPTMNKIAELLGLAADSTEEQICASVAALKDGPKKEEVAAALAKHKAAEAEAVKAKADLEAARKAEASAKAEIETLRAAAVARQTVTTEPGLVEKLKAYAKADGDTKRRILAGSFRKELRQSGEAMKILAANSLGSLAGDLILQSALPLLKLQFPMLGMISTDFSAENVSFNQAVKSRIRTIPTVTDYNSVTGYATSDAGTTDVPVTIDAHKAVQIAFNANEVASTSRDLFSEQVEGISYALGKVLVDALYANITAGNFANSTTTALVNMDRKALVKLAKALGGRGVAGLGRFILLNQDYYEALANDTTILNLAAYQKSELITGYTLPTIHTLQPVEAVNLPTTGNLTGFAGGPDSLVIATRLPNDYTTALPGANNGAVSTITNADTGISLAVTQFVDHTLGRAVWRAALMFGTAKGQAASGQRLISA